MSMNKTLSVHQIKTITSCIKVINRCFQLNTSVFKGQNPFTAEIPMDIARILSNMEYYL